jgi:uncharacterized membrane protein
VVGQYQDANGRYHGYVWERGRFTTIDAPGAVATTLFDINDRGQIVGLRLEADETFRGFVLERGRYTTFAPPGAVLTLPFDINNRGQIVGATASALPAEAGQGFLLAKGARGPFTPISVPGAPSTVALGLNDRGQITGAYTNPNAAPSPPPATAAAAPPAPMAAPAGVPVSTAPLGLGPMGSNHPKLGPRSRAKHVPSFDVRTATSPPSTCRARSLLVRPASTTAARLSGRTWMPAE